MSAPRLVATDLDGTLLDSEGRVSARTRAVLDELDAAGVPVVFTTGRPIRWMEELWEAVGGHGAVRGEVLEDVMLAQAIRRAGFRVGGGEDGKNAGVGAANQAAGFGGFADGFRTIADFRIG